MQSPNYETRPARASMETRDLMQFLISRLSKLDFDSWNKKG